MLGWEENYSSSQFGDFQRLFERLIGALFKSWLWSIIYFFEMVSIWYKKNYITAVLVKASLMHNPLHNLEVTVKRIWFPMCLMPIGVIEQSDNPNTQSTVLHDDVIKRKHFPRYWPFVRGIHLSPVNSLHKAQWRGALMCPLIWALNKQSWGWWYETLSRSLWPHRSVPTTMYC